MMNEGPSAFGKGLGRSHGPLPSPGVPADLEHATLLADSYVALLPLPKATRVPRDRASHFHITYGFARAECIGGFNVDLRVGPRRPIDGRWKAVTFYL